MEESWKHFGLFRRWDKSADGAPMEESFKWVRHFLLVLNFSDNSDADELGDYRTWTFYIETTQLIKKFQLMQLNSVVFMAHLLVSCAKSKELSDDEIEVLRKFVELFQHKESFSLLHRPCPFLICFVLNSFHKKKYLHSLSRPHQELLKLQRKFLDGLLKRKQNLAARRSRTEKCGWATSFLIAHSFLMESS